MDDLRRGVGRTTPGPTDTLLLRAAFLRGAPAHAAFAAWAAAVDFEAIDSASVGLLPLVHENLTAGGSELSSPLAGRIRGAHRRAWYANHLQIAHLDRLLDALQRAEVRTLLVGDAALALTAYPAAGLRAIARVEILVPPEAANLARNACAASGLVRSPDARDWPAATTASHVFASAESFTYVIHAWPPPWITRARPKDVWTAAAPVHLDRATSLAPAPADAVLDVIAHGVWLGTPAMTLAADIAAAIARAAPGFDWSHLIENAGHRALSVRTGRMLAYLRDQLDVNVPPEILARFDGARGAFVERIEDRARTQPGVAAFAFLRASQYLRGCAVERRWRGPLGVARFLRDRWRLESTWLVPRTVVDKTWQRVRRRRHAPKM